MKNSVYLKNKLKLNTNTIDLNQHNEVDVMRITRVDKTLKFCVGVLRVGLFLFIYQRPLSYTLNPPDPLPPKAQLNSTQHKHFCHLRCWFFGESRWEIQKFPFTKTTFVMSTVLFFVNIFVT